MNDFFIPFTIGLLCTSALFALCFLCVLGGRVAYLTVKRLLPQKPQRETTPPEKPKKPRQSKPVPKAVRSIEIDPSQIDRIYVKKTS